MSSGNDDGSAAAGIEADIEGGKPLDDQTGLHNPLLIVGRLCSAQRWLPRESRPVPLPGLAETS